MSEVFLNMNLGNGKDQTMDQTLKKTDSGAEATDKKEEGFDEDDDVDFERDDD